MVAELHWAGADIPNLSTNENIWKITDIFCPRRLPEVIKRRFHRGLLWNTWDLNGKEQGAGLWAGATWVSKSHP